jgi:glycerol dehydrogenase
MARIFKAPDAYVQGRNLFENISEYTADLGDSALLIADDVVLDIVGDQVLTDLDAAGVEASSVEFGGECSRPEIDRVTTEAEDANADYIIAAGGGKALDTAKIVADALDIGMVSAPTIASTDAPTSSVAVVYTEHGEFQDVEQVPFNPDLVLVDTEVIAQAPVRFFRSGMGDAMATWFEARACYEQGSHNEFGGLSTRSAQELANLCYNILREHGESAVEAVKRDAVSESVDAVVEANTLLSGLGFESGGLAAAHSIHNGLTVLEDTHDATHGEKVNFGTLTHLVLEERDDAFLRDFVEFSSTVGLPVTLAELGLEDPTREELDRVAEAALSTEPFVETIHRAFDLEPPEVRDAILTADAIGERYRSI